MSLNNAIARHLEQSPAKYAYRKIDIRSVFLGKGRQEITHAVFTSTCPRRLIICFVSSPAFTGNTELSPFTFEHANVRSISADLEDFSFLLFHMTLILPITILFALMLICMLVWTSITGQILTREL
uniref:Uncharacterized protein n=1 Tax=Meloidogyne hapla TaxID=6305 RepID=A0A1I8BH45_MELHA